ncbi:MAG: hypothetical protein HRT66_09030 [Flavobacteriaceae bacterium]|nr:hypothetical protein [Flavobacteriaceae bacterium]
MKKEGIKNELLRHILYTISYRFKKSIKKGNNEFGSFKAGSNSRTVNEIINHMYHVLNSTSVFVVKEIYVKEEPIKLNFKQEVNRFNDEINNLDNILSEKNIEINYAKRLLQGPLSDILTHIGQISMLAGLNGDKIKAENFSLAEISGRD